ncbi:MAG: PAS domain-containing protein [Alphaproteobacteria bacterium]|nr:PAS domain-containing protein [Alphaproteobacteria bacterium]
MAGFHHQQRARAAACLGHAWSRLIRALALVAVAGPAYAAPPVFAAYDSLSIVTFAAIALALALGFLGLAAFRHGRQRARELERDLLILRDRLAQSERAFVGEPGGLFLFPPNGGEPLARGAMRDSLAVALAGPDGLLLASAIETLSSSGEPFSFEMTTDTGERLRADGRLAGGGVALWLRPVIERAGRLAIANEDLFLLRAERDLLRSQLMALPFPAWRRRADLTLDWVNAAYAQAVGHATPDAAVAAQAQLDRRSDRNLAQEVLDTRGPVREKRYIQMGAQRRAFMFEMFPCGGGVAGIALDANATEELEQRLQRHMDAHDDTLNKLKTGVVVFDAQQKLTFYNRAYAQLFGFDDAWLETRPSAGELLERLRSMRRLPEQRDFPAWKRSHLALFATGGADLDELWHLPDDSTIRVMAQPHPLGGMIFLFDDVSSQLTLERNYNTLITVQTETLDSLAEGIAVFASDGRLRLSNASFQRLFGIDPARLEGEPHISDVAAHCRTLVRDEEAWATLEGQVTSFSTERRSTSVRLALTDGRIVSGGSVPLPDGAMLLSFTDITDSVRAEERLIERNEALEAADRLKTEFVSRVSYHLRTPLTPILGYAEALLEGHSGDLTARQQRNVASIAQGAKELSTLVNDILDLAYVDAGQLELELSDVSLPDLLASVAALVEDRASTLGVTLDLEIAPDFGVIVADARRLKQVVYNLLANALDHTPSGGHVTLSASPEGEGVALTVADSGIGIPLEYQPRAFDRFESRPSSRRRGVGLGLSLVKSFVELHGGWVSLQSAPNAGTRVTCHIPRVPAEQQAA